MANDITIFVMESLNSIIFWFNNHSNSNIGETSHIYGPSYHRELKVCSFYIRKKPVENLY